VTNIKFICRTADLPSNKNIGKRSVFVMVYINQGSSDQIEFKAECVSVLHKIALNIVFFIFITKSVVRIHLEN
jgi:hypothetical protein